MNTAKVTEKKITRQKTQQSKKSFSESSEHSHSALVIQRNYRGYKVRKEYGPLIAAGGKLDVETAHFIRHYCHKWKAKSLYQVLLLYRAKRYQDFVYFAQQAHMFNQSVVWSMQKNREAVPASALDAQPPRDFLEAAAERPNVFKLPFRLQDPLLLGVYSKADPLSPDRRASLMEDEPWDAPLRPKERNTSPPATPWGSKRDQEVQTSLASLRDAVHQDERRPSVLNGQAAHAPAAYKAPSYSATYREPRPANKFGGNGSSNAAGNKGSRAWNGSPAAAPAGLKRPYNPAVAELELRAQRHQSDDSDEPPFNFQAMLRKTNHGRASLRRRGSGGGGGGDQQPSGRLDVAPAPAPAAASPTPSGRRSPRSPRSDSPTRRPRDLPPQIRRPARTGSVISAELAPGIVVRGRVADL